MDIVNIQNQTNHWKKLALRDWKTARGLFNIKRRDASLFFCHLTLEKLLKGIVVWHTKKNPPFIHDLERLAATANVSLSIEQIKDLNDISAFNIAGRYSDYKFAFYKKCTQAYTKNYLSKTASLIKCLQRKFPKN